LDPEPISTAIAAIPEPPVTSLVANHSLERPYRFDSIGALSSSEDD
jgi:hypothetical protein